MAAAPSDSTQSRPSSNSSRQGGASYLARTKALKILGPMSAEEFISRVGRGEFSFEDEACASVGQWFLLEEEAFVIAHFGKDCWDQLKRREEARLAADQDATPTDPRLVRPAEATRTLVSPLPQPSASPPRGRVPQTITPPQPSVLGSLAFLRLTLFVMGAALGTILYLVFRILRPE